MQFRSDHMLPVSAHLRPATIALLFVVLLTVASIPIATHQLPPLSDYVNHLARTHVIDAIGTDPDLGRYYAIEWQIIPNLMIDLIVPVLHRFMSIYLAGQIFTIAAFALIASGTLVFSRALNGRWSPLPLVALPLLYNGVLLVGVMNYVFGIGLALWALAAWVTLRERAWPWRFAVSATFAFVLFFCHLFAAGVYGLGLLALELHRLWLRRNEPWAARLAEFVAAGIPFVPLIVLLVASPTWNAPGSPAFWQFSGKLQGLVAVFNVYYLPVAGVLLVAAAAGAAYAFRSGILKFNTAGWAILAVGCIAYLALPRAMFGAHLADQRLPIAIAFMLVACFQVDLRDRAVRYGFVTLVAALLAVRVAEIQLVWNHLDRGTSEFFHSVEKIKRGTRVLVVYGSRSTGKEVSDLNLVHAASMAVIERSALVSTEFTVKGKQILHAREEFRKYVETEDWSPPSLPYVLRVAEGDKADASYFWNDWPQHYDYVYILFTTPGMRNPDRNHLGLVYEGGAFQLYRVLPTISAVGR
jgi:hypothetical protein